MYLLKYFLVFILCLLMLSCSEFSKERYLNELTIATNYSIGSIKPNMSNQGLGGLLVELVYAPLFILDSQMNIIPILAKEITWKNNKKILEVKLKNIEAKDVKECFEKFLIKKSFWVTLATENLEKVEIRSNNVIRFYLKYYDRLFILALSQLQMISYSSQEKETGLFYVYYLDKNRAVLKRRIPQKNKINLINIRVIPNYRLALREFVSGSVDVLSYSNLGDYDLIKDLPEVSFLEKGEVLLFCLLENRFKNKTKSMVNWDTINQEFNREKYIKTKDRNFYKAAHLPIRRTSPWYNSEALWSFASAKNVTKSNEIKKLLFLAGQLDEERLALLMKRYLVGEKVEVNLLKASPEDFFESLAKKNDFDFLLLPIIYRDAFSFNYLNFHSFEKVEEANLSGYSNEKVDYYLDKARYIEDFSKAKIYFSKAIEELLIDPPGIFLFWINFPIVYRNTCSGFKFDSKFFLSLKDVQCTEPAP